MDLQKCYHNIDPSFILSNEFLSTIEPAENIKKIDYNDILFTKKIVEAFKTWGEKYSRNEDNSRVLGIPVGPPITHVFANVLLHKLDKEIRNGLRPIYYGRYMDDILIVMKAGKNIQLPT